MSLGQESVPLVRAGCVPPWAFPAPETAHQNAAPRRAHAQRPPLPDRLRDPESGSTKELVPFWCPSTYGRPRPRTVA